MQKGLLFRSMSGAVLSLFVAFAGGGYSQQLPDLAKLRLAAEKGEAVAQFEYGQTFQKRSNFPAATEWYRKAAEQGHLEAQWRLADILSKGKPAGGESAQAVPKSPDEAIKWVIIAAHQGHPTAQLAMGENYQRGLAFKQDYVEAYKWYRLASSKERYVVRSYLDPLILNMTTDQIAEGESRAGAFVPHRAMPKEFPEPRYVQDIKLRGVSGSREKRVAIINDGTFEKGEEASVKVGERGIKVKCLDVREISPGGD
jgi:hypothetical protein